MRATLVIMAAGLGSRYGGNKQTAGVGPRGETLLEYAVYDAVRAGFSKVVLIIKPEMDAVMGPLCQQLKRLRTAEGNPLELSCAFQGFESLPNFYKVPAGRAKPFGTVHALLCARECVHEPFCVINADDYYGVESFEKMYEVLQIMPEERCGAMIGYYLKNTVSPNGKVTRGLCRVEDGWLQEISEQTDIRLLKDGTIVDDSGKQPRELNGQGVVSMNFWGFKPGIFDVLEDYLHEFLRGLPEDEVKAECLLPTMVGDLLNRGEISVRVLTSSSRWFGMTYQEDRELVVRELARLHKDGTYPPVLRGSDTML